MRLFSKNVVERSYAFENTKNWHFRSSLTTRCDASHCRVNWPNLLKKLGSLLHTAESTSMVCIPPQSQALQCASYHGGKLRIVHHTAESNCTPWSQNRNLCESLVAFKGTIRRILLGVNTSIMKEKIWKKKKKLFAKLKILTPWCHAHCGSEFFELCYRISQRNRKRIRKYFSLFFRGPDGFVSSKTMKVQNLVTQSL